MQDGSGSTTNSGIAVWGAGRSLLAWLFAVAMFGPLTFAAAQTTGEVILDGKANPAMKRSIKCDEKPGDFPKYINTERLANCVSARIVTFNSDLKLPRLLQFTIKPGNKKMFGGTRAELADTRICKNGEEAWYRISTLIPTDFPIASPHRLVLAQWHELDLPGKPFHRPPVSHRLWNREFAVELFNKQIIEKLGDEHDGQILYTTPGLETGVFHEYVYKIVRAADESGEIRAWHRKCDVPDPENCTEDWAEFIQYKGSTGYDNDAIEGYYFKFGLYTTTKFDATFTAYHAAYSSGKSATDLGLIDPIFK